MPETEVEAATFPLRVVRACASACGFSLIKGSWVKMNDDAGVAGDGCDDGGGQVP